MKNNSIAKEIDRAVAVLARGGVIAYPTETVYGLGCDPFLEASMNRIGRLKGSDDHKSVLVIVQEQDVPRLAEVISEKTRKLMDTFWPGPLTLVLAAGRHCPPLLISPDGYVGMRHSSDPVCQNILEKWGNPLVSTSANPTGNPPAATAEQVKAYFGSEIDYILDGGHRGEQRPSSVVKIVDQTLFILREGAITRDLIEAVVGKTY